LLFLAEVFSDLNEVKDVGVPRLKVYCKGAFSFPASLIDITGCVVVNSKHGYESVWLAIASWNIWALRSDVMYRQPNSSCGLAYQGALLQTVINSDNRVVRHGKQKTRRHLLVWGSWIEQSWRSMSEPLLGEKSISFNDCRDVSKMDTYRNSH